MISVAALAGLCVALSGDKIRLLLDAHRLDSSHIFDFDKDGKCPQIDIPE